ncbi:MAG TPA: DUF167 family protein [Gammaproteobacteria bacterium]
MSKACYRWDKDDLILNVRVQPRSSKDEICDIQDQWLKVRITAPPVDGKANTHLIRFLAREFKVRQSQITLLNGGTGREKRLHIRSPAKLLPFIGPSR